MSSAALTCAAAASSAAAATRPAASTTSTTAVMASSSSRPLVSPFLAALLDGSTPPPLSSAPITTSAGLFLGAAPRAPWPFASAAASVPAVVGPLHRSAASSSPAVADPIAVPPPSSGVAGPIAPASSPAPAPGTAALAPFLAAPTPASSSTTALAPTHIQYGAGLYGQPLFYGTPPMAYGAHSPPPALATPPAAYVPPAPVTHEAGPVRDPPPVHLAHLVTVKLNPDNYLVWRAQVLPLLRSYYLDGYVDGTIPCPPPMLQVLAPDGTPMALPNPAHRQWMAQDRGYSQRYPVISYADCGGHGTLCCNLAPGLEYS
nr:extensin-like [Lolium perenne]